MRYGEMKERVYGKSYIRGGHRRCISLFPVFNYCLGNRKFQCSFFDQIPAVPAYAAIKNNNLWDRLS